MISIPTINSFIRFLHASPGTPAVDIYSNGELIFSNLDYKEMSDYLVVGPDTYRIQVFPAGEEGDSSPVLDTELVVSASVRLTVPIIGTLPDISLLPLLERFEGLTPNDSIVRFAHLSPNTPQVDVTLPDGTKWFSDVAYTQVTDYRLIISGVYDLQIRPACEEERILTADTFTFGKGNSYTVYAVGLLEEEPALEMIYYEDQIPFLEVEPKKIQPVFPKKKNNSNNANNNIKITFRYSK
ncbi:DUF4397 domain-containing protein [Syntrophomonas erecta]